MTLIRRIVSTVVLIFTLHHPAYPEVSKIVIRERVVIADGYSFGKSGQYEKITDRRQAIARALQKAQAGDFVLIAGKGHETYQIFNEKTIDFDDKKIALEILNKKRD